MTNRFRDPIFVVGYQHSGTTLLENILGNEQSTFTTHHESTFFEHQYIVRKRFPSLNDRTQLKHCVLFLLDVLHNGFKLQGGRTLGGSSSTQGVEAYTDETLDDFVKDFEPPITYGYVFRRVYDLVARKHGCDRWVEKTPTHIFYVDDIVRDIPEASFVEIVRDPRDILAAKKTNVSKVWDDDRFGEKEKWFRAQWMAFDPILDCVSWKATIRAGLNAERRYEGRWYRLRYEDLVAQPEATVRKLCEFLELDFEEEMLRVSGKGGAEWQKHHHSRGIRRDSVARWRQVLTPSEVAAAQWVVGNEMADLGYSRESFSGKAWLTLPLLLARSATEVFRRLASKWRVGGWEYSANVLHNWKDRAVHVLSLKSH